MSAPKGSSTESCRNKSPAPILLTRREYQMSNFGVGIGSFMNGLAQGASIANQQTQQDRANALAERQMKLSENADSRSAAASEQSLAQSKSIFDNNQADRVANQPIVDLQRAAQKDKLEGDANVTSVQEQAAKDAGANYDAMRAKSISNGTDANGNPTFFVDGQQVADKAAQDQLFERNHGTRMDNYYKVTLPKLQQAHLDNGDPEAAAVLGKAHQDADFKRGVDSLGRLEGHYGMGNWDGVNTELKNIIGNSGYMNLNNYDVSSTPIKDAAGKTGGLQISYTDKKTGKSRTTNFNDLGQLHATLSGIINPQAAIDHNAAQDAAATAAKVDAAKGSNKLANDITLANVNSGNTRAENAAKALLPENVKDREAGISKWFSNIENGSGFPQVTGPDGKQREMTVAEKQAEAARQYDSSRTTAGAPPAGAQAGAPALGSVLPAPVAPTPGEPANAVFARMRSVLPTSATRTLQLPQSRRLYSAPQN